MWTLAFLGMAVVNVVGVVGVSVRYHREGCFSDDDSDSEDEEEDAVPHPDAMDGSASKRAPVPPAADRSVARRDKRARLKVSGARRCVCVCVCVGGGIARAGGLRERVGTPQLALASEMVGAGPLRQRKPAEPSSSAPASAVE
jgi:hypothetical protein